MNITHFNKQVRSVVGRFGIAGLVIFVSVAWGTPDTRPSFDEVSGLVRSNLAGATPEQIDWVAVQGLLRDLSPRVSLVDGTADPVSNSGEQPAVKSVDVYRDTVGYIRLGTIEADSPHIIRERYDSLRSSNHLSGLVLDLRGVSGGEDYAAALGVADMFLPYEVPLLNWGEGLKSSKAKDSAILLPVAVLVDDQTGGAAEALAAMLRQSGVALLFGGRTAGTAGIKQAFPLKNGQLLRIMVSSIQLGNAQTIPVEGLWPDVEVATRSSRPVAAVGPGNPATLSEDLAETTNAGPARLRMDEAGLVRRWRGEMLTAKDLEQPSISNQPESQDPVLVRALDLMDGLAILRSWQK